MEGTPQGTGKPNLEKLRKGDYISLTFKHRANREISFMSETTTLVVEALKTLGKEHVDDNVIAI